MPTETASECTVRHSDALLGAAGFEPAEAHGRQIYSLLPPNTKDRNTSDLHDSGPQSAAQTTAREAGNPLPDDLTAIVKAWPELPAAIRAGILAMVQAAKESR